jgi:hypothetical protein
MSEPPKMKNWPGRADEIVNRIILIAPWVVILAGVAYLGYTGSLSTDIQIVGNVPVAPLVYGLGLILGATYALALMKFYGAAPVAWVFTKAHNLAKNYNPEE